MAFVTNLRQFTNEINKFNKRNNDEILRFFKLIAFDLFSKLTVRTPVDTGRARASWVLSVNRLPPDEPAPEQQGRYVIQEPDLTEVTLKTIIFITNTTDYIEFLDQGTSDQAPRGIVDLAIAETENKFL